MTDPIQRERLHVFLNRVMSDEEIIANPRFNTNGLQKIANHMKVDVSEVPDMLIELSQHLDGLTEASETEDDPRFTWEDDTYGGITVRDTHTGEEKYLGVQQSSELMRKLDSGIGTEQDQLMLVMKESVEYELSADELGTENSIFNFPWRLNESAGFAAAQWSGFGPNFQMKIVSVVDQNGDPTDVDNKQLLKIAKAFINDA